MVDDERRRCVYTIEIRFRINEKAHALLQKLSEKEGVPMSYILRGITYQGIESRIRKLKKEGRNIWD